MIPATLTEIELACLQPQKEKVIVIAGGSRDLEFAEDLRQEIRQSGWDCEIVQGRVSDRRQVDKLVHEVLDCFRHANVLAGDSGTAQEHFIPRMTDEEWLAQ
jgi:NAD(P)-dependent dehydrogenase (short-subunit alcohol dehydrogenase family)